MSERQKNKDIETSEKVAEGHLNSKKKEEKTNAEQGMTETYEQAIGGFFEGTIDKKSK